MKKLKARSPVITVPFSATHRKGNTAKEKMTTISAPSSLPVDPPSVPIVEPPVAVDWMATLLEQDEPAIDGFIASLFEDLPPAEPKDYAEAELDDLYEDCDCDECRGVYTDDRDGYDDYDAGDWYWNDGGGYCDW